MSTSIFSTDEPFHQEMLQVRREEVGSSSRFSVAHPLWIQAKRLQHKARADLIHIEMICSFSLLS
jgi:hypothetical protein